MVTHGVHFGFSVQMVRITNIHFWYIEVVVCRRGYFDCDGCSEDSFLNGEEMKVGQYEEKNEKEVEVE